MYRGEHDPISQWVIDGHQARLSILGFRNPQQHLLSFKLPVDVPPFADLGIPLRPAVVLHHHMQTTVDADFCIGTVIGIGVHPPC